MNKETAKAKKERIDILLVAKGLAQSREKAKAMIMAGQVFADGQRVEKSGQSVSPEANIEIRGQTLPYVSRGGLKLEKALAVFPISLQDALVIDIGASTGGFTDCALQNGAREVIAVDVGYGQLSWKLRNDPRVKVMEKTNARYLQKEHIGGPVDFVTIDVSFISLDKIFPVLPGLMKPQAQGVALIKPQFEAGKEKVGKKGVVKDPEVHREVIHKVLAAARANDLTCLGLDFSPIKGPEGNIEYLLWFGYKTDLSPLDVTMVEKVVEQSIIEFKGGRHDS